MTKLSETPDIRISLEAAHSITRDSLIDVYQYLKEEMRLHLEEDEYLHPEDLAFTVKFLPKLKDVIAYFDGEVE